MARHFEIQLFKKGFYTIGLGFPLFPQGMSRLRIIITSNHSIEQVDALARAFKEVADECNFWEHMKTYDETVASGKVIGNPDWWKSKAKL